MGRHKSLVVTPFNFNSQQCLRFTKHVLDLIAADAIHFHYISGSRNSDIKANVNGFLNILLPIMADLRLELHERFLKYNDCDEQLCYRIEDNIYNVYLKQFYEDEEDTIMHSFRISSVNMKRFISMFDKDIQIYNMPFATLLQSLVKEYIIRTLDQRELIVRREEKQQIHIAIEKEVLCIIHVIPSFSSKEQSYSCYPVTFSTVLQTKEVFVVCICEDCIRPIFLKDIKQVTVTRDPYHPTEEELEKVCAVEEATRAESPVEGPKALEGDE